MNVTDEQLLDFRDAVHRTDHATVEQMLRSVRDQNPVGLNKMSDAELQRALLLRASRVLMKS